MDGVNLDIQDDKQEIFKDLNIKNFEHNKIRVKIFFQEKNKIFGINLINMNIKRGK